MTEKSDAILLTGANGFIGRYVSSVLSTHGKNIIALDWRNSNQPTNKLAYLSLECDVANKERVEAIFRQYTFTAVIHLASILNTASRKNPLQATHVNILGSLNILEAAREFEVPKVIYGSSISAYAPAFERNQSNTLEGEPIATEDVYGATKRYVETLGNVYHKQFDIKFVALRMSHVIGVGEVTATSAWRSDIFNKLGLPDGGEIAFPYQSEESLPLVHVEDVANMIEQLVDATCISSTAYDTPSETWALSELANYIQSLNKNLQFTFGQSRLSGVQNVISGSKFINEFEYTPVSIRERLQRTAQQAV